MAKAITQNTRRPATNDTAIQLRTRLGASPPVLSAPRIAQRPKTMTRPIKMITPLAIHKTVRSSVVLRCVTGGAVVVVVVELDVDDDEVGAANAIPGSAAAMLGPPVPCLVQCALHGPMRVPVFSSASGPVNQLPWP